MFARFWHLKISEKSVWAFKDSSPPGTLRAIPHMSESGVKGKTSRTKTWVLGLAPESSRKSA